MSAIPIILSGLGVALLAGLTSGASGARARELEPVPRPSAPRRKRSSKRSSSLPATRVRTPPKPKPKAKRKPTPPSLPLNKEYVITSTKGEPIQPHTVRVRPPEPPKTKPSAPSLSPRAGAQRLYDYAGSMLRGGRGSELGTKGKPNKTVKAYQLAMGGIAADGIYGPRTRARGKELIGKTFPARLATSKPPRKRAAMPAPPPPPPPAAQPVPEIPEPDEPDEMPNVRPPKAAAQDLFDYAKRAPKRAGRAAWFGLKNKPSQIIRAAQRDMGGLVDDGIYGPATRKRGRALLGRVFPAR